MSNRVETVKIGPPISLGRPVTIRISQASAFIQQDDGHLELYTVSNGSPSVFYVVNVKSGKVHYEYEIPNAHAVWGMTTKGKDVYFCSTEGGILYRYTADKKEVEQLGDILIGHFVWDMDVSQDGNIYGASYPNSEIFEYNPNSNQFRNLGSMDESQYYVRGLLAVDDFLYAGLGSDIRLIQYEKSSGTKKELHIDGYSGSKGFIYRIYKSNRPNTLYVFTESHLCIVYDYKQEKIIDKFQASSFISEPSPYNQEQFYVFESKLYSYNAITRQKTEYSSMLSIAHEILIKSMVWVKDEEQHDVLAITNTLMEVVIYNPITNSCVNYDIKIPASPVAIQSLEWDEQETLYIGGYHRGLSLFNTTSEQVKKNYPTFPQIEGIGFNKGNVYFGTYTKANIYSYNPSKELDPAFLFKIGHQQDRPFAIAEAGDKVFFGTIADYGLLTGAIAMYDTTMEEYETFPDIVPNQSIIGLVYRDGLLYGGTTNWGGLGIEPTEIEAKLFVWDVVQKKLLHRFTPQIPEIDIPPRMIGELTFGKDGLLWGAIDGTIFAMCPETLSVVKSKLIFPSEYKYTHVRPYFLRWSSDGLLFTTLARKLIVIDPDTLDFKVLEDGPLPLMTVGPDGHIYYNDESELIIRKRIQ